MLFFVVGTGVSATVEVFQTRAPVVASSATTLPRNEQQGYRASPTCDSSRDDTGTYNLPLKSCGAAVIAACGCSSTSTFHRTFPTFTSTAYTLAAWSPK